MSEKPKEPNPTETPQMKPDVRVESGSDKSEFPKRQVDSPRKRLDWTENELVSARKRLAEAEEAIDKLDEERERRERRAKRAAVAGQVLAEKFPDKKFKVLSTEGSSCIVFEGDDGLVYKVGVLVGSGEHYDLDRLKKSHGIAESGDYMAREAEHLKYLADRGLAPKLIKYLNSEAAIDKLPWYKKLLRDRHEEAALPVLVMEKADFDPEAFKKMPLKEREAEAERITKILEQDGEWAPGDTEPVVDKKTGKIVFIDAGGWLDAKKRKLDVREQVRFILKLNR